MSQLVAELIRFLRNPVIHLKYTPADEIAVLQMQVQELQRELDEVNDLFQKVRVNYSAALGENQRYRHLLRSHGISVK